MLISEKMILPALILCALLGGALAFNPIPVALRPRAPKRVDQSRAKYFTPARASPLSSIESSTPCLSSADISALSSQGYVVVPDFISPGLVSALREDVSALRSVGNFRVARIGQDSTNALNEDVRVAETCFLGRNKLRDSPNESRGRLYDALDAVREDLSGNPALQRKEEAVAPALEKTLDELLYAFYPRGGFYRRHRDSVAGSASVLRIYSLLLYLNDSWEEKDGGKLRMHMCVG